MIDDHDIDFAILSTPGGLIGSVVTLAIVIVLCLIVRDNRIECESHHCERGKPMLIEHECACVESPTP